MIVSLNKWKKIKYCPFSKWLSFIVCGHCERIVKLQLTLDGLRTAWKGESIDWNRERDPRINALNKGVLFVIFFRMARMEIRMLPECPFTL